MLRTGVFVLLLALPLVSSAAEETVNLDIVHRIKNEAFVHSLVMDHLFQLTDVNGPRLTGSPGFQAAATWVIRRAGELGLHDPHLEPWGPFGRAWSFSHFELSLKKPVYAPLHATPMAWCEGTKGPVTGEVIAAPLYHEDDVEPSRMSFDEIRARIDEYKRNWHGKLRDKIVLLGRLRDFEPATEAPTHRMDDKDLSTTADAPTPTAAPKYEWPITRLPHEEKARSAFFAHLPSEMMFDWYERFHKLFDPLNAFFKEEGLRAVLRVDKRGAGGIVFAEWAAAPGPDSPLAPPTIMLVAEHYNRLWRLVEKSVPVELNLDLTVAVNDHAVVGNVVAELPGDKKAEEFVMLGAHLDSWHAGTGATDNGAGCAVVLESMRILKALNLKLDRTVRMALWSGEEQGLYGSRAYVKQHFGDPVTMKLTPEHAKLSVYFNLDNGSGKVRGVYLQGNDMARPIFESWLAPFKDLGVSTISIRNTGGTDHLSFDAVGLPGFQFIQDPLDYGSRTHHSELDVYDHAEPGDLMQAAAVMASLVYDAANRVEAFPRKPLPDPLPPKTQPTE